MTTPPELPAGQFRNAPVGVVLIQAAMIADYRFDVVPGELFQRLDCRVVIIVNKLWSLFSLVLMYTLLYSKTEMKLYTKLERVHELH